jgi:AMP deaminase
VQNLQEHRRDWDLPAHLPNRHAPCPLVLPQIPRLYNIYKDTGVIENFQQMLDNIFEPLFEVTQDPASHPQLHVLLSQV